MEPHCCNLCCVIILEVGGGPLGNVTIIVSLCFSLVLCLTLCGAFPEADYGSVSHVMVREHILVGCKQTLLTSFLTAP